MAFDNVVFPLILEAATSVPEFSTTIISTGSGAEQRIGNWLDARVTFNAAMGVRSKADLQKLIIFHRARKGRLRGFLVKDMLDYQASGDIIAVGDGVTKVFQLQRVYSDNTTSTAYGATGNTDNRPIYKPTPATVTVYAGAAGTTLLTAGGFGATATATVSGGAVTAVTLTNGGTGYTSAPTVTFSGGGGTGAAVTATISGGAVTGFTGLTGGSGYTTSPTITIITTNGQYTLDYRTGVLTLVSALTLNHILNWFGEFYIPCRFMEDKMPADVVYYDMVENRAAGNIPEVGMMETRDFS
jgi:uncharacterized protein (TIGR02217 family)